jgi:hypothetical protein
MLINMNLRVCRCDGFDRDTVILLLVNHFDAVADASAGVFEIGAVIQQHWTVANKVTAWTQVVRESRPDGHVNTWSWVEKTDRRSVFQLSIIWFMARSASCDVSADGTSPSARTPSSLSEPLIMSPAVSIG